MTQLLFSHIYISNVSPDIGDTGISIENFTVTMRIAEAEQVTLGDKVYITLPDNLPYISSQNNDDGRFYASYTAYNNLDESYQSIIGINISIYKHTLTLQFSSLKQTFIRNDIQSNKSPIKNGDYIVFKFSSLADVNIIAAPQRGGEGIIELSSDSDTLILYNETTPIVTPTQELTVNNPAVTFDKTGLGAKSNANITFFIKDGLPKDARVQVTFPDGFDISAYADFSNFILVNQAHSVSNTSVDDQNLSFTLNTQVIDDTITLNLFGDRIINTTSNEVMPFAVNIYKDEATFNAESVYPEGENDRTYFYNHSETAYSWSDEIHIEFSKAVAISLLTTSAINLEDSSDGRTLGTGYTLEATNSYLGYSDTFKITLELDANLTQGLEINISKDYITSNDGYKASENIIFTVPNVYTVKPADENTSILYTHTKLFAQSKIDMLYDAFDDSVPNRANYNDLIYEDVDKSGSYTQGDTLLLTFTTDVYSSYLLESSSVISIVGAPNLGRDYKIETYNSTDALYSDQYKLTLGANTALQEGQVFGFRRSKVLSKTGGVPTFDVSFSPIPGLSKPALLTSTLAYEDNDDNEIYSSGDKIIVTFDQEVALIDVDEFSIQSGNTLGATFASLIQPIDGYAKEISITLGDSTNLVSGDELLIPKDRVKNKHQIAADIRGSFRLVAPSLKRPNLVQYGFNAITNNLTLSFDTNLQSVEDEKIYEGVTLSYEDKSQTLSQMKENILSIVQDKSSIFVLLNASFMKGLNSSSIEVTIEQGTIVAEVSGRSNKTIEFTFFTPLSIHNLIPNQWNLVAIEDRGVETSIGDLFATEQINNVYAFDVDKNDWLVEEKETIKRGHALWVNPINDSIVNIASQGAKSAYEEKTTLLNKILPMNVNQAYYLGNSVSDCANGADFKTEDVKTILSDEEDVVFVTYSPETGEYDNEVESVGACQGFLIFKVYVDTEEDLAPN